MPKIFNKFRRIRSKLYDLAAKEEANLAVWRGQEESEAEMTSKSTNKATQEWLQRQETDAGNNTSITVDSGLLMPSNASPKRLGSDYRLPMLDNAAPNNTLGLDSDRLIPKNLVPDVFKSDFNDHTPDKAAMEALDQGLNQNTRDFPAPDVLPWEVNSFGPDMPGPSVSDAVIRHISPLTHKQPSPFASAALDRGANQWLVKETVPASDSLEMLAQSHPDLASEPAAPIPGLNVHNDAIDWNIALDISQYLVNDAYLDRSVSATPDLSLPTSTPEPVSLAAPEQLALAPDIVSADYGIDLYSMDDTTLEDLGLEVPDL
ncbi:acetyl-CoA C-acetyltransferase [Marssonina coronariae]|uniref:Acetyl-CoA C-acetyltransferase n=1 Tax=Diplocarpon coronariae TaxID=2795749 RepID=A0A218ZAL0_9HELO|nr:acetyl-CoA C-acetyltransferase [Marssonina coronariae]